MIFIDASALVAILARESEGAKLFGRIEAGGRRFYSAITRWEAVAALRRSYQFGPEIADRAVQAFLDRLAFEIAPIGAREAAMAVEAARTYGKGRHPAALNMGDGFAYACAKSIGAELLYKGDDFAKTDLA